MSINISGPYAFYIVIAACLLASAIARATAKSHPVVAAVFDFIARTLPLDYFRTRSGEPDSAQGTIVNMVPVVTSGPIDEATKQAILAAMKKAMDPSPGPRVSSVVRGTGQNTTIETTIRDMPTTPTKREEP